MSCRNLLSILLAVITGGWSFASASCAAEKPEANRLLAQMKALAQSTLVRDSGAKGQDARKVQLVPQPVFRYSDQPRRIIDASLWVWTDGTRPVAMQKIEAVDRADPTWTICFSSFSSQTLSVRWDGDRTFATSEAGLSTEPLPDPPQTAPPAALRRQVRQVARRFGGRITHDLRNDVVEVLRLLPRPVYEYAAAEAGVLAGAVFGFASNGTNPDAYLVLEVTHRDGKEHWSYGWVRMTTGGLEMTLDDRPIWTAKFVKPAPVPYGNWYFFKTPRETK